MAPGANHARLTIRALTVKKRFVTSSTAAMAWRRFCGFAPMRA